MKYDPSLNTWITIVGTGTKGYCADGTALLSCDIDPQDVFVTNSGQVYFMDRGLHRAIDSESKILTLMGQSFSSGDGAASLSARFNTINSIDVTNADRAIVLDQQEYKFREFEIGGNIQLLAGNGKNAVPNTTDAANSQPIYNTGSGPWWDDFKIDPATGNVFYNGGTSHILMLNRSTGRWVNIMGGGATSYAAGDGLSGSSLNLGSYPARILGFDGTNILASINSWNGATHSDSFFKLYTISDGTQSSLAGVAGAATNNFFCNDGTAGTSCAVPQSYAINHTRATYDTLGSRWLFMQYNSSTVRNLAVNGNVGTLTTLTENVTSFAYRRDAGLTVNQIFYCSSADKKLHKKDLVTLTDTAYSWPVSAMACTGRALIYNATRGSLIFPYTQNNLTGIAEYTTP